jgi:transcriptional regulator with XRE-family HTH domain
MARIYTGPDKRPQSPPGDTRAVDDRRAALTIRTLRVRRGWRQKDLAARAGVSRQLVTKIESGRIESVPLRAVRKVVAALGGTAEILIRAPGGEADRALNAGHAAMHEAAARLFRRVDGWVTAPEVTFSITASAASSTSWLGMPRPEPYLSSSSRHSSSTSMT